MRRLSRSDWRLSLPPPSPFAYYKQQGKLFEVERKIAESSPDEVFTKVCELFE